MSPGPNELVVIADGRVGIQRSTELNLGDAKTWTAADRADDQGQDCRPTLNLCRDAIRDSSSVPSWQPQVLSANLGRGTSPYVPARRAASVNPIEVLRRE